MPDSRNSRITGDTLSYTDGDKTTVMNIFEDEGVNEFIFPFDIAPEQLTRVRNGKLVLTHAGKIFDPRSHFLTAEGPDGQDIVFWLDNGFLRPAMEGNSGQFSLKEEYLIRREPIHLLYKDRDGEFLNVHEFFAFNEEGKHTPLSSKLLMSFILGKQRRPLKFFTGDGTETSLDTLKSKLYRFFIALVDGQHRYLFLTDKGTLREMTAADSMRLNSD